MNISACVIAARDTATAGDERPEVALKRLVRHVQLATAVAVRRRCRLRRAAASAVAVDRGSLIRESERVTVGRHLIRITSLHAISARSKRVQQIHRVARVRRHSRQQYRRRRDVARLLW